MSCIFIFICMCGVYFQIHCILGGGRQAQCIFTLNAYSLSVNNTPLTVCYYLSFAEKHAFVTCKYISKHCKRAIYAATIIGHLGKRKHRNIRILFCCIFSFNCHSFKRNIHEQKRTRTTLIYFLINISSLAKNSTCLIYTRKMIHWTFNYSHAYTKSYLNINIRSYTETKNVKYTSHTLSACDF